MVQDSSIGQAALAYYEQRDIQRRRQRTRTLLLFAAMAEVLPKARLRLDYSLGNAFYYHPVMDRTLLPADVDKIRQVMRRLAEQHQSLQPVALERAQALDQLTRPGSEKTHAWLSDHNGRSPTFYSWEQQLLAFKGPLCDNTDETEPWELIFYPPGMLLHVTPDTATQLPPYRERPTLFRAFYEAERWGEVLGVQYVSEVNQLVRSGELEELARVAEALHGRKVAQIADRILETRPRPQVVLISGPTASGKTSFSRRLQIQLRLLGLKPLKLSLDDFYLPRESVPKRANGDYDFEVLQALDIDTFNEVLLRLIGGESVELPTLDFQTHLTKPGPPVTLEKNGVLLIEGIHGLNPKLTPHLTEPTVFRVYVSALTHLNLDHMNRISTTDLRQLRRLVRDQRSRGYQAEETLSRWPVVREGEHKHIFPYQERADVMFNSALPHELSALKTSAQKLLSNLSSPDLSGEAQRLLQFLDAVEALPQGWLEKHVPPTSILREFIGGSVLVP